MEVYKRWEAVDPAQEIYQRVELINPYKEQRPRILAISGDIQNWELARIELAGTGVAERTWRGYKVATGTTAGSYAKVHTAGPFTYGYLAGNFAKEIQLSFCPAWSLVASVGVEGPRMMIGFGIVTTDSASMEIYYDGTEWKYYLTTYGAGKANRVETIEPFNVGGPYRLVWLPDEKIELWRKDVLLATSTAKLPLYNYMSTLHFAVWNLAYGADQVAWVSTFQLLLKLF